MESTDLAWLGGSAYAAQRLLGPSLDYVGQRLLDSVKAVDNFVYVLTRAADKVGPEGLEAPGSVPPRVVRAILQEAPYTEDQLAAEYLSGVLASSRSGTGDDRGVAIIACISRLSTVSIKFHFLVYRALFEARTSLEMAESRNWYRDLVVQLSIEECIDQLSLREVSAPVSLLMHGMASLEREQLLKRLPSDPTRQGNRFAVAPTDLGLELLLFAMGLAQSDDAASKTISFTSDLPRLRDATVVPRKVWAKDEEERVIRDFQQEVGARIGLSDERIKQVSDDYIAGLRDDSGTSAGS